jgi:hypothetical protein
MGFISSVSAPVAVFPMPVVLLLSAWNPNALLKSPLPSGKAPVPNAVLRVGLAITGLAPSTRQWQCKLSCSWIRSPLNLIEVRAVSRHPASRENAAVRK